ncbi:hypothetical protein GOP47_0004970 [Adiantum capillus-veneris]|uniref:Uncharacterized protein n=1 Tax=Adiantum capillus-veneris TaxID=13818 RepID=A0A9D4V542_ADICA|nr:hypothetical protein GOP47_0004970 [Adiantum capillus-veneris]
MSSFKAPDINSNQIKQCANQVYYKPFKLDPEIQAPLRSGCEEEPFFYGNFGYHVSNNCYDKGHGIETNDVTQQEEAMESQQNVERQSPRLRDQIWNGESPTSGSSFETPKNNGEEGNEIKDSCVISVDLEEERDIIPCVMDQGPSLREGSHIKCPTNIDQENSMDIPKEKANIIKKWPFQSKKRKVLKEMQDNVDHVSVHELNAKDQGDVISRSSRIIKTPTKYNDFAIDKENVSRKGKKSRNTKKDEALKVVTHITNKVCSIDVDTKELLALQAMDIHDVDKMYGKLWEAIRPLKAEKLAFFQECSGKSDPSYLLEFYVEWALEIGRVTLPIPVSKLLM